MQSNDPKPSAKTGPSALSRLFGLLKPREYSSGENIRSDSDNGKYPRAVRMAVSDDKIFTNFKRARRYNSILEHVSFEQGQTYLEILQRRDTRILDRALDTVLVSDEIGNPRKFDYGLGMPVSPTTLRYLKVASDIEILFGTQFTRTAEIGCGYGGQAIVNDTMFTIGQQVLFDLPIVNQLIQKYVESFCLNGAYQTSTLNMATPTPYDLVISNYAFSELPKVIETTYIAKVLSQSKMGYLTMNSGLTDHAGRPDRKLTLDELRALLPNTEIFTEEPLTNAANYILVWGHKPGSTLSA